MSIKPPPRGAEGTRMARAKKVVEWTVLTINAHGDANDSMHFSTTAEAETYAKSMILGGESDDSSVAVVVEETVWIMKPDVAVDEVDARIDTVHRTFGDRRALILGGWIQE